MRGRKLGIEMMGGLYNGEGEERQDADTKTRGNASFKRQQKATRTLLRP
jgi:hypothetical protein